MNIEQDDAEAMLGIGVLNLLMVAGIALANHIPTSTLYIMGTVGIVLIVVGAYHDEDMYFRSQEEPTDKEVEEALVILDRLKAQENKIERKEEIDRIRRAVSAVYGVNRERPTVEELDKVEKVMSRIGLADWRWMSRDDVRGVKERGLQLVEYGKHSARNEEEL